MGRVMSQDRTQHSFEQNHEVARSETTQALGQQQLVDASGYAQSGRVKVVRLYRRKHPSKVTGQKTKFNQST